MNNSEQYYKWVKASDELPEKDCWIHTSEGLYWFYDGRFYTDTFYSNRVTPTHWLKPVERQQSQPEIPEDKAIDYIIEEQKKWAEGNNDSDAVEFLGWCFATYGHTLPNSPEWFYKWFKQSKL